MVANSLTIGTTRITRIDDWNAVTLPARDLLPDWDADWVAAHSDTLPPGTYDAVAGTVPLPVHGWLVEDGDRVVLVDTGAGNGKPRPHSPWFDRLDTPFLANLAAAGIAPEDVTHVLHTHLHVDHVGWNTVLRDDVWVPTFANARHVFVRAELAFFTDPANLNARTRTTFAAQQDSLLPVVAVGLADPVDIDGGEAIPGFTFQAAPGHSPHHATILYRSGGAEAVFIGDAMHHPVQVVRPEWNSRFDADPVAARESRRQVLAQAADLEALVLTAHFGDPSAGWVRREGEAFRWEPAI